MKRLLFVIALALGTLSLSYAQEVGIRFGYSAASSAAVDVVFGTGDFSRIHADLSFGGNGVGIEALWDFLYRPLGGEAFNWYAGVGPYTYIGDPFHLGVLGEIGLEYRFASVPIVLGGDWRPFFRIIEDTHFGANGFGINVRWVF
ncbi:MAG: outer membrane insertion C- signal [Bacteroidota bacterium]